MSENNKAVVFFIMPFKDDFLSLYDHLKEHFKDNFLFTNAGDLDNQQNILQDIIEGIGKADAVIVDLTELNPNVFYELGLAHAMNKKVIIITQEIDTIPFDLKSYRAVKYNLQFNKLPALEKELQKLLFGALDGSVRFGNPVADFLPEYVSSQRIEASVQETEQSECEIADDEYNENEEKGFLDFMAEIEEDTNSMTDELDAIATDMNEMTKSIKFTNEEITRVNSQSGQNKGTASFVRGICRKLAVPVGNFSNKFNERVSKIDQYWSNIENNYLLLLDDEHLQTKESMESMQTAISALCKVQDVIYDSNAEMDGFILSMQSCLGLERKLTQAIISLISETENYLSVTEKMASSIDRIQARSEVVFKEFYDKAN